MLTEDILIWEKATMNKYDIWYDFFYSIYSSLPEIIVICPRRRILFGVGHVSCVGEIVFDPFGDFWAFSFPLAFARRMRTSISFAVDSCLRMVPARP